jgi:pimeloyl-ACP methyl ester carboxylesterase
MTFIEVEQGQLHYKTYGNGERSLLCFHGFGQDHEAFESWSSRIGDDYTLYAFDIFYHGASTRPQKPLTKEEWSEILKRFLEYEGIQQFDVYGYSLGGRFAIASALAEPDRIGKLILSAPDGIFLTVWFKLATNPLLRGLFKYLLTHPEIMEHWVRFGEKTKVVSRYVADFVRKELHTNENRDRVFVSWNAFKSLGYSKSALIRLFNRHSFQRQIILGQRDHIITPSKILPLIEKMSEFDIHILPLKHHQLVGEPIINCIFPRVNKA